MLLGRKQGRGKLQTRTGTSRRVKFLCSLGISPAGVQVAGSCFRLFMNEFSLTLYGARDKCQRRGGVLASLRNREAWQYFWQKFKFQLSSHFRIYVDLKTTPNALSHM